MWKLGLSFSKYLPLLPSGVEKCMTQFRCVRFGYIICFDQWSVCGWNVSKGLKWVFMLTFAFLSLYHPHENVSSIAGWSQRSEKRIPETQQPTHRPAIGGPTSEKWVLSYNPVSWGCSLCGTLVPLANWYEQEELGENRTRQEREKMREKFRSRWVEGLNDTLEEQPRRIQQQLKQNKRQQTAEKRGE